MPHLSQNEIDSANGKDLAEFLLSKGIRLEKKSKQYCWKDQNVWIHNNEWYSHYEQTGGLAVSFVIKYFDKTLQEAVAELNGNRFSISDYKPKEITKPFPQLEIPPRNSSTYRMYMYLHNARGIDSDVINFFVHNGTLYEDSEYHNCIFVGSDESGKLRHIHKRSTTAIFKQTIAGSQAEYAFHYNGTDNTIFAFEAPIDMLAFISMNKENWQQHSYVALCSVSEKALLHQLDVHNNITRIVLCLDNDDAGQSAEDRITETLKDKGYTNIERLIPKNKDWDEDLIKLKKEETQCQESKSSFSLAL